MDSRSSSNTYAPKDRSQPGECGHHWWPSAKCVESPNYNQRPADVDISLLVIHNISLPPGEFGGGNIEQFFLNQLDPQAHPYFETLKDLRVSAHCLIDRHGEVTQFVAFDQRAWHAGVSCFKGRRECNDFAIGIELEGTDTSDYTDAQYHALRALTQDLIKHYPKITTDRIVGHCDIAPGRKTDPGNRFDWDRYLLNL